MNTIITSPLYLELPDELLICLSVLTTFLKAFVFVFVGTE